MIFNNILVWDNFFSELEYELIINEASLSNFTVKEAAYMGFQADHLISDEVADIIHKKISDKLNTFLYLPARKPALRLALKDDRTVYENPIHTDASDPFWDRSLIACIISLTDAPSLEEDLYMGFYKNSILGKHSYSLLKLDEAYSESYKWEEQLRVKYKKNRAIIFHPCLFHGTSRNTGYGSSISDGRLSIHGFYRMCYNELTHGKDYKIGIKELV